MSQRLYMILLEDDPDDPGFDWFEECVRESCLDTWNNCGSSAMQSVLGVEGFADEEEPEDLNEVLADLQAEIAENKN